MASPDCCESQSTLGSISHGCSCPSIRAWKVLTASPKGASAVVTAPDDHRIAGPHCCVIHSRIRCISCACGCPTVRDWIVSATSVRVVGDLIDAAPDNHLIAGPHC